MSNFNNHLPTVKALSIRRPWPWAIFSPELIRLGISKDIENRDWKTYFRGRIAVHVGAGCSDNEYESACYDINSYLTKMGTSGVKIPSLAAMPKSAIVGLVDIVDCVAHSSSAWFVGDYGFKLENPVALPKPISCSGSLKFWDVPDSVRQQIFAQLPNEIENFR